MQWTDKAIIINSRKYGESSGIISVLTHSHGLYKALVKGITGKKQCGIFQTGNLIDATWRGRLPEHLGNLSAELVTPYAALLLREQQKLAALSSVCAILEATLPEREVCSDIFELILKFIECLNYDENWLHEYVKIELYLLAHLGFGLDLSECAATGTTNDLTYISPKSGRAVCTEAGAPYKSKLFSLPQFFISEENCLPPQTEIMEGLEICAYFLDKYIFSPHNNMLPIARTRFGEMMKSVSSSS